MNISNEKYVYIYCSFCGFKTSTNTKNVELKEVNNSIQYKKFDSKEMLKSSRKYRCPECGRVAICQNIPEQKKEKSFTDESHERIANANPLQTIENELKNLRSNR